MLKILFGLLQISLFSKHTNNEIEMFDVVDGKVGVPSTISADQIVENHAEKDRRDCSVEANDIQQRASLPNSLE